jgi:hypothetical protein
MRLFFESRPRPEKRHLCHDGISRHDQTIFQYVMQHRNIAFAANLIMLIYDCHSKRENASHRRSGGSESTSQLVTVDDFRGKDGPGLRDSSLY